MSRITNKFVAGGLGVNKGGTGVATIPVNGILIGNGTNAVNTISPSTNGNVLTSNGTTWSSAANPKITSITYSSTTPSRSLNTNFTPSATNAVWVFYTISISCTITLAVGQTGSVELRSDTNATPTTVRSKVSNTNSGLLTLGLNLVNAQESILSYLVPPGHNVRLVSSGGATISLTNQNEVALIAS